MGFRFRKSFGSGPFRFNISKSGIGYSVGGKGFRYAKKAGGGKRTTITIPGTGISYVKDSKSKKRGVPMKKAKKNSSKTKKPMHNRWWVWLIAICLLASMCGSDETPDETTLVAETESISAITETTEVPTESTTVPTAEPTTAPSTEPTTEPSTEPTTISTTEATEPEPEGRDYVMNTNSRKFHYPSCSSADDIKASNKKDVIATREDLISQGYSPCGRCHP